MRKFGVLAGLLLIAWTSTAAAESGSGQASKYMRFERAVVLDATGFEQPMAASTLFLPVGWTARGGVFWGQQFMCTNGYNYDWSAHSPDGSMTLAILPQTKWETNNYNAGPSSPGCQLAPYTNIQAYLQALSQHWRPGSRVLDFRRRQDIERDLASFNLYTPSAMGGTRSWVEAGEVLLAFNENGRELRGSVAAAVVFSLTVTEAPGVSRMESLGGFALPAWAASAPYGQLNFSLNEAIRRSIKQNPAWGQRISGHNAAIGRVAIEESRKRANIIAQTNSEISRIREEAWNSYQESSDRRAREFGEAIRGVETYADPNAPGGSVELSHMYDQAWRMNDGTYVLTDDPSFEPYRDLGMDGMRLEAVR